MASGLQCPGCGHVHPAGLPEIAGGDTNFRCYGCYRMLSVPEGWTGRPPRPTAASLSPTDGAPPGAGTRDARTARLAGRRGRAAALARSVPEAPSGDLPTQLVPAAPPDAPLGEGPPDASAGWSDPDRAGERAAGRAIPLGWVAPRRSAPPVPKPLRGLVWALAFGAGLVIAAFVLRKIGVLDVNTAIELYAGSGARRFGILLVLLPLWALLSATIAHFSLEGLARRRSSRPASRRPPANTASAG